MTFSMTLGYMWGCYYMVNLFQRIKENIEQVWLNMNTLANAKEEFDERLIDKIKRKLKQTKEKMTYSQNKSP